MNIFYNLIITVLPQRVGNQIIKGFLLAVGGERQEAAEQGFDEFRLQLFRRFGKIQHGMDVAVSVVKSREKEPFYRRIHYPVTDSVFNCVGFRIVKKAWF